MVHTSRGNSPRRDWSPEQVPSGAPRRPIQIRPKGVARVFRSCQEQREGRGRLDACQSPLLRTPRYPLTRPARVNLCRCQGQCSLCVIIPTIWVRMTSCCRRLTAVDWLRYPTLRSGFGTEARGMFVGNGRSYRVTRRELQVVDDRNLTVKDTLESPMPGVISTSVRRFSQFFRGTEFTSPSLQALSLLLWSAALPMTLRRQGCLLPLQEVVFQLGHRSLYGDRLSSGACVAGLPLVHSATCWS